MKNLVLGINLPVLPDGTITYDGNIALCDRENVVMAIAEERVSKKKYDGHVRHSIAEMLERYKLTLNDLEAISVVSFSQPMEHTPGCGEALQAEIKRLFPEQDNIHYVRSHHEAHAASALCQADLNNALVVVVDHTGNMLQAASESTQLELHPAEQTSYFKYVDGEIQLVARDHANPADQGYGRFYGDITCYLGFNSYRESGKTMGLASFGDASVLQQYEPFIHSDNGEVISALREESYLDDCTKDFRAWFAKQGLEIPEKRSATDVIRPFDMHLAAWAQDKIEQSICRRVKDLMHKHDLNTVVVVGGVAMNSVLNRALEEKLGVSVYVPPSPGDAGLALGAAAEYLLAKDQRMPVMASSPYLGFVYSEQEVADTIKQYQSELEIVKIESPELVAAKAISEGETIGWFQGRSEYGPRALGNRSILSSPANSWQKEILNSQIKLREWFRPYAPVVLEEKAGIYFDMLSAVPYMMQVAPVKDQAKLDMPACIHVDGTARLQTVNEQSNAMFYRLIKELDRLTGTPVVLNTSFNLAGMPIVETPKDAIECFKQSIGMGMLIVENYLIRKK